MRAAILAGVLAVVAASLAITVPARQGSACCDTIYAVTSSNLLRFDSTTPGIIDSTTAITGLQAGEIVRAIDFRPATGQLYGIGDTGQLYTIDTTTAAATPVGAPFALVDAVNVSIDFNPTVDRIRVVSGADENFRLNPNTGAAIVPADTNLAYDATDANAGADPDVLAIAYTNNFAGATVTTLFGIDNTLGILVRQGSVDSAPISPNAGTLFTIGAHGAVSAFNRVGLDVGPSGTAFAYLEGAGGVPQLYTIDLATGTATLVGGIASPEVIIDIAAQVVPPTPTPSSAPTAVATASPTPAASPTPVQPAALPPTGGGRSGESDLVLAALIGVAAVLLTAGTLAYRRRRVG